MPAQRRTTKWIGGILVLISALLVLTFSARAIGAFPGLTLGPRHLIEPGPARLSPAREAEIRAHVSSARAVTVEAALAFALRETSASLHFGLSHRTTLRFEQGEREGNCVEYAQLFVTIFEMAAHEGGIDARAIAVRSDARLFGRAVPMRGWRDHDWVMIEERHSGRRWFVDPTLADQGWVGTWHRACRAL